MVYIPCTLTGMGMEEAVRIGIHTIHFGWHGHEEAVRIGIHTMCFDEHGHGGGSKDWYMYHVL